MNFFNHQIILSLAFGVTNTETEMKKVQSCVSNEFFYGQHSVVIEYTTINSSYATIEKCSNYYIIKMEIGPLGMNTTVHNYDSCLMEISFWKSERPTKNNQQQQF